MSKSWTTPPSSAVRPPASPHAAFPELTPPDSAFPRWRDAEESRATGTSGLTALVPTRNQLNADAAGIALLGARVSVVVKPFSETERQNFLAAKHVAVLSVDASNGRPPASVPIWYDYTPGGHIRINTGASRKSRLIERAGVVTLVVQHEEPPYQYVIVEGTVVDTTTPSPLEVREAIAIRYLGEEGGRAFVRSLGDHESVLFTIRPDRWLTADFSADI